jgi:hypothetical protein
MQILTCPRCIPEVHLSDEVFNDVREELCSLLRKEQRLQGLTVLSRKQLPLIEAKFIVMHLTNADGTCHRCRAPVEDRGAQSCKKCRSLNLNWCE